MISEYIMQSDLRNEYIEIMNLSEKARIWSVGTYCSVMVMIVIMLCIIFSFKYGFAVLPVVMPNISRLLLRESQYNMLSALRSRVSKYNFIFLVMQELLHPNIFRNMMLSMVNKIAKYEIKVFCKETASVAKSRKTINHMYLENKPNTVADYWKELGLNEHRDESSNCVVTAIEPIRPKTENSACYMYHKTFSSEFFFYKLASKWTNADQTDEMHVKSLNKRLLGKKKNSNRAVSLEFVKVMMDIYRDLPYKKESNQFKVHAALATDGTAGQFSKRSKFEEIWKDPSSPEVEKFWLDLIEDLTNDVFTLGLITHDMVSYMLYVKREALPIEKGEVKVTRIMNSPNLVIRIADSVMMHSMNGAFELVREKIQPTIGLNIFVELKMILIKNDTVTHMELDVSDFDGGLTCEQILGNGLARVSRLNGQISKFSDPNDLFTIIKEICYVRPRYKAHCFRHVSSTFGISYDVAGSQASGDGTTSDDNSVKSAAFGRLLLNGLRKQGVISDYELKTHGDDHISNIVKTVNASNYMIEQEVMRAANNLGWLVKENSLIFTHAKQDGKAKFLSHGVTIRQFRTSDNDVLEFAVVTRDLERLYAKLSICAEYNNILTRVQRCKFTSKLMSFWVANLGHPDVMYFCMLALIDVHSYAIKETGQYSWSGVTHESVRSFSLTDLIKLQLPLETDNKFRYIKITGWEAIRMTQTRKVFKERIFKNESVKKYIDCFEPQVCPGMWFDYSTTFKYVRIVMEALDRASYIYKPKDSVKWWEDKIQPDDTEKRKQEIKNKHDVGKVLRCEHMTLPQKCNNVCKYDIKISCKECFDKRQEKMYENINCCLMKLEEYYLHALEANEDNSDSSNICDEDGEIRLKGTDTPAAKTTSE
jgi:hypothetical protein